MRYTKQIVAAAFAASMVTATAYAQQENEQTHPHETVKMKDLPAPVKQTLQREAQGKTIDSIAKETEHGTTSYQARLTSNGKQETLEISDQGKVLERRGANQMKGATQEKGMTQPKSETKSTTRGY